MSAVERRALTLLRIIALIPVVGAGLTVWSYYNEFALFFPFAVVTLVTVLLVNYELGR